MTTARRVPPVVPPGGVAGDGAGREAGVDLARGLALVAMFVAHSAPSPGPGGVLALSDHLAFPLFALLVGAGAELGARRTTPPQHPVGSAVRAVTLLLLGWLLARTGAQVVVVLAPLGVLTLLCWALVRCSTPVVVAVGLLAWAAAPWSLAVTHEQRWQWMAQQAELRVWLLDLVASTLYPQALLVACAAVGIGLARWVFPRPRASGRDVARAVVPPSGRRVAGAAATLAGATLMLGTAGSRGHVDLVAYGTTWASDTFVLLLAATALLTSVLLTSVLPAPVLRGPASAVGRAAGRATAWLSSAGAMALTLYVLHVGWLAHRARGLRPGEVDDAWTDLLVLLAGGLVLAVTWRATWRATSLGVVWRRGPLEGLVTLVAVSLTGPRSRGASAPRRTGLTRAARQVPAGDGG